MRHGLIACFMAKQRGNNQRDNRRLIDTLVRLRDLLGVTNAKKEAPDVS